MQSAVTDSGLVVEDHKEQMFYKTTTKRSNLPRPQRKSNLTGRVGIGSEKMREARKISIKDTQVFEQTGFDKQSKDIYLTLLTFNFIILNL